jgi:hypothetical protein
MKVLINNRSGQDLAVVVASVADAVGAVIRDLPFGVMPRGQGEHRHLPALGITITLLPVTPERPTSIIVFDVTDYHPGRNPGQCTTK